MVLPDIDVARIKHFCEERLPRRVRDKVRLEVTVHGRYVDVDERRPPWTGVSEWTSSAIARLRYDGDGLWTLYFGDRYGGWTLYFDLDPKQPIDVLIHELDEDPTGVCWG